MTTIFTTDYDEIIKIIEAINPIRYSKSRNYINGDVTQLSPYISRGVISTQQILKIVLSKGYKVVEIEKFIQQLAWRDYFQLVWQAKGNEINTDLKNNQLKVSHHQISTSIINASTHIEAVDTAIKNLYLTGYMHNHNRMYTASIACNIAQNHWHNPAQWMYYHLLDGDWASNACSWQWVAGAFSSKKYFANQENINKYTQTHQEDSFLNVAYEAFENIEPPQSILANEKFIGKTNLPNKIAIEINADLPTFIYNYYNLDPLWHLAEDGNRILLLDPAVFEQYPVSDKCIAFMLALAKNINGIKIYVGSFQEFSKEFSPTTVFFKEHPLNNYNGVMENRSFISKKISGYFPSFFSYWKKLEKQIKLDYP